MAIDKNFELLTPAHYKDIHKRLMQELALRGGRDISGPSGFLYSLKDHPIEIEPVTDETAVVSQ